MLLAPGQTLASYEILSLLGKGGMGEVYRAKDSKLDRDVAIKVLPEEFARDEERLLRFQREAKLLASLNHPHIAAIHGFESVDQESGEPIHFLVLEYVEGESLAQRLENGPLTMDDALEVCEQIAQGLEAAHDKGIVHRDLKPQNVQLRSDGSIKVLDFGLARAMADSSTTRATSDSPTITADFTQPGVVLGTAAYMSPEQARGRSLDARTDIWSFGAVLYECLTGKVLFSGESATESLGAILHKEPEWPLLPAGTPPMIQVLLRRCLAKDRKRRLRSIADAELELREAIADPTSSAVGLATGAAMTGSPRRWARFPGGLVLGAALTAAAMVLLRPAPSEAPEPVVQRYAIPIPEGMTLGHRSGNSFDVSRDGRIMVLSASENGPPQLYVREADQMELRLLRGTEGAVGPRLSPDGQWVVYNQNQSLQKISIRGGLPITLFDGNSTPTVGWSEDGWIYFVAMGGIRRISENGGEHQPFDPGGPGLGPFGPREFPGGAVLFAGGTPPGPNVTAITPDGSRRVTVVGQGSSPQWSPTGHLLFARQGTLMAAAFDPMRLDRVTQAVPLIEGVATRYFGMAEYVMTRTGTLYHIAGSTSQDMALVHVDMDGNVVPLPVQTGAYSRLQGSPDGRRIALAAYPEEQESLWVLDVERDVLTPLQSGPTAFTALVWSPDGEWIYYVALADQPTLHRIRADGSARGEPIPGGEGLNPSSISADGMRLYAHHLRIDADIVLVHLEEDVRVEDVIAAPGGQWFGALSPDGAWLAYVSLDPGQADQQVYISAADGQGGRVQVSRNGGRLPAWSPDGTKLYFNSGQTRMVVEVQRPPAEGGAVPAAQGSRLSPRDLEISPPTVLFTLDNALDPHVELSPDGEAFLTISRGLGQGNFAVDEIIVTVNFSRELERMVPVEKR